MQRPKRNTPLHHSTHVYPLHDDILNYVYPLQLLLQKHFSIAFRKCPLFVGVFNIILLVKNNNNNNCPLSDNFYDVCVVVTKKWITTELIYIRWMSWSRVAVALKFGSSCWTLKVPPFHWMFSGIYLLFELVPIGVVSKKNCCVSTLGIRLD